MTYQVSESSITRIILKYLRDRDLFDAFSSLLLETNVHYFELLPKEFLFLQRVILQGRWEESHRFLAPFLDFHPHLHRPLTYLLNKQCFLEACTHLSNRPSRHILPAYRPIDRLYPEDLEVSDLTRQLAELQAVSSRTDFQHLSLLLTTEKWDEHPDASIRNWSVMSGRVRCWEEVVALLTPLLPATTLLPTTRTPSIQAVVTLALQKAGVGSGEVRDLSVLEDGVGVGRTSWMHPNPPAPSPHASFAIPTSGTNSDMVQTVAWPTANTNNLSAAPSQPLPTSRPGTAASSSASIVPSNAITASQSQAQSQLKPAPVSWTVDLAAPANPAALPSFLKKKPEDRDKGVRDSRTDAMGQNYPNASVSASNHCSHGDHNNVIVSDQVDDSSRAQQINAKYAVDSRRDVRLDNVESTSTDKAANLAPGTAPSTQAMPPPTLSTQPSRIPTLSTKPTSEPQTQTHASTSTPTPNPTPNPNPTYTYTPQVLTSLSCPARCCALIEGTAEESVLAVGTNNKSVHILKVHTPAHHTLLPAPPSCETMHIISDLHKGSVYAMEYHSPSQRLLTGSNDKTIKVCKPADKAVCGVLKGHTGTVRGLRWGVGGLVSGGAGDCRPRVWDVDTESCIRLLSAHPASIHALSFLDAHSVLTGCEGGVCMLHDLRSAHVVWKVTVSSQSDGKVFTHAPSNAVSSSPRSICSLASVGSSLVCLGQVGGHLSLLDLHTQRIVYDMRVHTDDIRCVVSAYTPSPSPSPSFVHTILSTSYDGTGCVWGYHPPHGTSALSPSLHKMGILAGAHSDKILSALFLQPGAGVITTGADGQVVWWGR